MQNSSQKQQRHILLLEDDDILAMLIQETLEREGYKVTRCRDGVEGLALLQYEAPDLILLDIQMPRKNGYQFLEGLHSHQYTPPVIVISNSGQPVELQRLADLGVVDYLIKAEFDPDELLDRIKKFFSGDLSPTQPLSFQAGAEPQGATQHETEGATSTHADSPKRQPVVLLVEDDAFLADIILQKLRQFPYALHLAQTGEAAVQLYKEHKPDLILLDLLLPGMSGVDVLRHIRAECNDTSTRVIVVSNFSEDGHREEVAKLGVSRYLVKASVSPSEIAKAVEEELRDAGVLS